MKLRALNEAATLKLPDGSSYMITDTHSTRALVIMKSATSSFKPFAEMIEAAGHNDETFEEIDAHDFESLEGLGEDVYGAVRLLNYQGNNLKSSGYEGHLDIQIADRLASLEGFGGHVSGLEVLKAPLLKSMVGGPRNADFAYAINKSGLVDFSGAPERVGSSLILADNQIKGFTGAEGIEVQDELHLNGNQITSFRGIDKVFKSFTDLDMFGNPGVDHILNIFKTTCTNIYLGSADGEHRALADLINKHLTGTPKKIGAILEIQEELLDAGYSHKVATL